MVEINTVILSFGIVLLPFVKKGLAHPDITGKKVFKFETDIVRDTFQIIPDLDSAGVAARFYIAGDKKIQLIVGNRDAVFEKRQARLHQRADVGSLLHQPVHPGLPVGNDLEQMDDIVVEGQDVGLVFDIKDIPFPFPSVTDGSGLASNTQEQAGNRTGGGQILTAADIQMIFRGLHARQKKYREGERLVRHAFSDGRHLPGLA
ncbi:hypothetical protein BRYFOR_06089 [Marvinbryantia formatexigens DSM 14469]|uniref:Uncharacterized protein n=1 Tax=Marvinbryantia formatexigens DSM 14469 TaxID=478749 RepID=C6LBU4_9FIRM|nr:hypothetical protein BRYFOR_06089 [Marvinbryantia formatexigens DSM 14469]